MTRINNTNRSTRNATATFSLFVVLLLLLGAGFGHAQDKKWTGKGGNTEWGNKKNWDPEGVPTDKHSVEIKGDAGTIHIKGGHIKVKSITIKNSTKPCGTVLTALEEGGGVFVRAVDGDVKVGKNSKIAGRDGNTPVPKATGQNGGFCKVQATGKIVNMGKIVGGKGGDGWCPGSGGFVLVKAPEVDNRCGCLIGGEGGSFTGDNPADRRAGAVGGNRGGKVHVHSPKAAKTGTVEGGKSGVGYTGSRDPGKNGDTTWHSQKLGMAPGEKLSGKKIALSATQSMDLRGLQAGAFVATHSIYLNAYGNTIDLTGIASGTLVFNSADVCVDGNVLLDPGVTLNSLCTGNVHQGICADRGIEYVLFPETFTTGGSYTAPSGWIMETPGGKGFSFDNVTGIALPRFAEENRAAVVDAGENGPDADFVILDTLKFSTVGIDGPILLEWDQWHQSSTNSNVEVFVSDGNNMVPVFFDNQGTSDHDHPVIDITNFIGNTDDAFIRFQYTGIDQSWWVIDNVEVRVAGDSLHGRAPVQGIALFDINNAKNIDGLPVHSQEDGPYFTTADTQTPAHLHFEGPANSVIFLLAGYVNPQSTVDPVFGLLDLEAPFLLDSGLQNGPFSPFFHVQPSGFQDILLPIAPQSAGTVLGLQATFLDPQNGQTEVANAVQLEVVN